MRPPQPKEEKGSGRGKSRPLATPGKAQLSQRVGLARWPGLLSQLGTGEPQPVQQRRLGWGLGAGRPAAYPGAPLACPPRPAGIHGRVSGMGFGEAGRALKELGGVGTSKERGACRGAQTAAGGCQLPVRLPLRAPLLSPEPSATPPVRGRRSGTNDHGMPPARSDSSSSIFSWGCFYLFPLIKSLR